MQWPLEDLVDILASIIEAVYPDAEDQEAIITATLVACFEEMPEMFVHTTLTLFRQFLKMAINEVYRQIENPPETVTNLPIPCPTLNAMEQQGLCWALREQNITFFAGPKGEISKRVLWEIIANVSEISRHVAVLYWFADYDITAVARLYGLSIPITKDRLEHIRITLLRKLGCR